MLYSGCEPKAPSPGFYGSAFSLPPESTTGVWGGKNMVQGIKTNSRKGATPWVGQHLYQLNIYIAVRVGPTWTGLLRSKGRWQNVAQEQGFSLKVWSRPKATEPVITEPSLSPSGKLHLYRTKSVLRLSVCTFLQNESCNLFWETWWFSKIKLVSFSWHEYSFQAFLGPRRKMLS